MKDILGATLVVVTVMFVMLAPFITYNWYDHTQWVQEMVAEDIAEFREHDVDWTTFDINRTAEEMRREIADVAIKVPNIFSAGIREERHAYQDALYNLIIAVVNEPDNHNLINERLVDVIVAQTELYVAAEVFTSNTLYAMRYTF